ncbi:Bug family tripartite tricarboxylate transporter substrate binding protein [Natrialba chahannaoensis]|uniref:Bug family tripartite tricarboxylate transporter substrate binding protein n=1 Tax=Natrialba chahannaoensis TaxID=68911 RepID=UPI00187D9F16|nr:tripartite tricarboxylate transporter substrate-binding protein [Natrialba chahannaoensis]
MERRSFVKSVGAISAVGMSGLAGCLGDESVTWMIPWSEGGGTDQYARQMQPLVEEELDGSIEIDNREGAGSMIGSEWLLNQDADGSVFGTVNPAGWTFTWRADPSLDWEPSEFEPIAYSGIFGYTIIVNNDYGIENFDELRDGYEDGDISGFAYQGSGSDSHLVTLLLEEEYGLNYDNAVPYDGGGPVQEAVLGDEVGAGIATNTSAAEAVDSGEASAIVNLMDVDLMDTFPGIDRISNYGDSLGWLTEFYQVQVAPPGTDEDTRQEIADAIEYAVEHEDTQEWMDETGNIVEFGNMDEAAERYNEAAIEEMEENVEEAVGGFDVFLDQTEEED